MGGGAGGRGAGAGADVLRGGPPGGGWRGAGGAAASRAAAGAAARARAPGLLPLVEAGALHMVPGRATGPGPGSGPAGPRPEVWVLGTNHASERSEQAARQVVQELQADAVVLELCRSRANLLFSRGEVPGAGIPLAQLARGYLAQPGLLAVNLGWQLMGASYKKVIRERYGVEPGMEMRAAYEAATEAGVDTIVLGDRPVQVTVRRALSLLSLKEKLLLGLLPLALLAQLAGQEDAPGDAPAESDDEDQAIANLGSLSPTLLAPLLHERDVYLAWSMRRSKAVREMMARRGGAGVVVGVVGRAHLPGVLYSLQEGSATEALRFRDLIGDEGRAYRRELLGARSRPPPWARRP